MVILCFKLNKLCSREVKEELKRISATTLLIFLDKYGKVSECLG